jgi:hypothetical protein
MITIYNLVALGGKMRSTRFAGIDEVDCDEESGLSIQIVNTSKERMNKPCV